MANLQPLTIAYYDEDGLWPDVASRIQSRLQLANVNVTGSASNPNSTPVYNTVDLQFLLHSDDRIRRARANADSASIAERPYVHINLINDTEKKEKQSLKRYLKAWTDALTEQHEEWMIVYVVALTEGDHFGKRMKKALDSIRGYVPQSSGKKKDRVVRVPMVVNSTQGEIPGASDLWEVFFSKLGEFIEASIEIRYAILENESLKFENISTNQTYFQCFLAKEGLARLHYKCHRYKDALAIYDSLDVFRNIDFNSRKIKGMFREFGFSEVTDESPILFDTSTVDYHKLFTEETISYLSLKQYLFAKQLALLLELESYTKLGKLAIHFITRLTHELHIFTNPVSASVWSYLACMQLAFFLLAKCPIEGDVAVSEGEYVGDKSTFEKTVKKADSTRTEMKNEATLWNSPKKTESKGKQLFSKSMQSFVNNFNNMNAILNREFLQKNIMKKGGASKRQPAKLFQRNERLEYDERTTVNKRSAALLTIFGLKQLMKLGKWRDENNWSGTAVLGEEDSTEKDVLSPGYSGEAAEFTDGLPFLKRSALVEFLKDPLKFGEALIEVMIFALQLNVEIGNCRHAAALEYHIIKCLVKLQCYGNCSLWLERILLLLSLEPWTMLWVECKKLQLNVNSVTNQRTDELQSSYMLSNSLMMRPMIARSYNSPMFLNNSFSPSDTFTVKEENQKFEGKTPEEFFELFINLSKSYDNSRECKVKGHHTTDDTASAHSSTHESANVYDNISDVSDKSKGEEVDIEPSDSTEYPRDISSSHKFHMTCAPNIYCWAFPLPLIAASDALTVTTSFESIDENIPEALHRQFYRMENTSEQSPIINNNAIKSMLTSFNTKRQPKIQVEEAGSTPHNATSSSPAAGTQHDVHTTEGAEPINGKAIPRRSVKTPKKGMTQHRTNSHYEDDDMGLEKAILKQLHQPSPLIVLPCNPKTLNTPILSRYFSRLLQILPKASANKGTNNMFGINTKLFDEDSRWTTDKLGPIVTTRVSHENRQDAELAVEDTASLTTAKSHSFSIFSKVRTATARSDISGEFVGESDEVRTSCSFLAPLPRATHKRAVQSIASAIQNQLTLDNYNRLTPLSVGESFSIQLGIQSILPSTLSVDRIILKLSKLPIGDSTGYPQGNKDAFYWLVCDSIPQAVAGISKEKSEGTSLTETGNNGPIQIKKGLNIYSILWRCPSIGYYLIDQILLVVGCCILQQNFEDIPPPGLYDAASQSMGLMMQLDGMMRLRRGDHVDIEVNEQQQMKYTTQKEQPNSIEINASGSTSISSPEVNSIAEYNFTCERFDPLKYLEEPPILGVKPIDKDISVYIEHGFSDSNCLMHEGNDRLMAFETKRSQTGVTDMLKITVTIVPSLELSQPLSFCIGDYYSLEQASRCLLFDESRGLMGSSLCDRETNDSCSMLEFTFQHKEARLIDIDGEKTSKETKRYLFETYIEGDTLTVAENPLEEVGSRKQEANSLLFLQLPEFKRKCSFTIPFSITFKQAYKELNRLTTNEAKPAESIEMVLRRNNALLRAYLYTLLKVHVKASTEAVNLVEYRWIQNVCSSTLEKQMHQKIQTFNCSGTLLPLSIPSKEMSYASIIHNKNRLNGVLKPSCLYLNVEAPFTSAYKIRRINNRKCITQVFIKCLCEDVNLLQIAVDANQVNATTCDVPKINAKFEISVPSTAPSKSRFISTEDQHCLKYEVDVASKIEYGSIFSFLIASEIEPPSNETATNQSLFDFDLSVCVTYTQTKSTYVEDAETLTPNQNKQLQSSKQKHSFILRNISLFCPIAVCYAPPSQGYMNSLIPISIRIENTGTMEAMLKCEVDLRGIITGDFLKPDQNGAMLASEKLIGSETPKTSGNISSLEKGTANFPTPCWFANRAVLSTFTVPPATAHLIEFDLLSVTSGELMIPSITLSIMKDGNAIQCTESSEMMGASNRNKDDVVLKPSTQPDGQDRKKCIAGSSASMKEKELDAAAQHDRSEGFAMQKGGNVADGSQAFEDVSQPQPRKAFSVPTIANPEWKDAGNHMSAAGSTVLETPCTTDDLKFDNAPSKVWQVLKYWEPTFLNRRIFISEKKYNLRCIETER